MKSGPYKPLELEKQAAEFWDDSGIFKKYMVNRKGGKKYYFLDGPPYATGSIHLGTAMNKILKDFFIRFFSMSGYDVSMQPGYDTHGLPIENKIEKQLNFRSKADIEKFGIENFNVECRRFATKFIETMNGQFKNLGVWMDWDNPYLTLDKSYIEGAWYTFKKGFENGLLYKGNYPVHVCSHCVDPDSTILVENGTRKIKELEKCWQHNNVVSFDTDSKKLCITKPLGYMRHKEDAFVLRTELGKKIIASNDHPFWTKNGWLPMSSLKTGTEVATYNSVESRLPLIEEKGKSLVNRGRIRDVIEGLETSGKGANFNDLKSSSRIEIKEYVRELRKKGFSYRQIIKCATNKFRTKVSKSWVSKIIKTETSTRYDLIIKDLEQRSLLPLYSKNAKAFVLARLAGHMFGDGSIIAKRSPKRKFPIFTLVFTGKEEDMKEIQKDLDALGYNYTPITTVRTRSRINGRLVDGFTTSMRCYAHSLAVLLVCLGAPTGRKSECIASIPRWVYDNKKLAREFLASYFGSELDIVKPRRYEKGFEVLRLHMHKDIKLKSNGIKFAKAICELVGSFGISTGKLVVKDMTVNDKSKSKITISIDCNDDNIIRFLKSLGYEYCKERKTRASHALGYLYYKKRKEREMEKIKNRIIELRKRNFKPDKIAARLKVPEFYVRHVLYGKSKHTRPSKYIPVFGRWLSDASKNLKDGMVWDIVEKIKYLGKREVCDIAVETHHNFIVNGFLAHNCETAVSFNEIEHKEVQDSSIYVKFRIKNSNDSLLIWTTTPWTLPSNTGIMTNPDYEYVRVKTSKDILIMAKDLAEKVMLAGKAEYFEIIGTLKGSQLIGTEYENPLKDLPLQKNIVGKVVPSEQYVTLEEGTGLVHVAPGHGREDYLVGIKHNLPVLSPLTMGGTFKAEAGWLEGKFVKDAEKEIIEKLREKNALFAAEIITHEYPKCWRCDSSLLFIAVPQWFFRVSAIREKLVEENEKVSWSPSFASDNFESWLNNLSDWPISRQRYWGIPLPIWECEKCESVKVFGSSKELGIAIEDLHRPYIDEVVFKCSCGGVMKRIPDVLDVWFDSGVASWASIGFPQDAKTFESKWPADLNIEGPDQFRGWWNSQMITSVITFGKTPFKNVLLHGKVLDLKGAKMSKSRGNIITPEEVIEKYGRDSLRLYLLGLPAGEDFAFDMDSVRESMNILNTLWNSFSFLESYCKKVEKPGELNFEDDWIISRINRVAAACKKAGKDYNTSEYARVLREFILKDLSRWYIRLIRERTWPSYEGADKNAAFYTMYYVFDKLVLILAPICPFISEIIYQSVSGEKESVHLEDWPEAEIEFIGSQVKKDDELVRLSGIEFQMEFARSAVEAINSMRQENNVRLRWPLRKAVIQETDTVGKNRISEGAVDVIKNAGNVKELLFSPYPQKDMPSKSVQDTEIYLDVRMDNELLEESMIMELVRKVQTMRKDRKLDVSENILLFVRSDAKTERSLRKWEGTVKKSVGASKMEYAEHGNPETLEFEGVKIYVGFDLGGAG
ncbi:MAG: isoleucine--tRNA ligase [Candidatus Aenigmarchaeota archaeon]|nr:isoleucine--tRNA ligase [Candidatus Aenigmarchaeota archaeon]